MIGCLLGFSPPVSRSKKIMWEASDIPEYAMARGATQTWCRRTGRLGVSQDGCPNAAKVVPECCLSLLLSRRIVLPRGSNRLANAGTRTRPRNTRGGVTVCKHLAWSWWRSTLHQDRTCFAKVL